MCEVCRKFWFEGYCPKPQGENSFLGGALIIYYNVARNFHNLILRIILKIFEVILRHEQKPQI